MELTRIALPQVVELSVDAGTDILEIHSKSVDLNPAPPPPVESMRTAQLTAGLLSASVDLDTTEIRIQTVFSILAPGPPVDREQSVRIMVELRSVSVLHLTLEIPMFPADLIRVAEMPVVLMPSVPRAEREQCVIVDEDI